MLSLPHRPGSLYSLISKFSVLGLNLTKLESRPIAGSDFEFKMCIRDRWRLHPPDGRKGLAWIDRAR